MSNLFADLQTVARQTEPVVLLPGTRRLVPNPDGSMRTATDPRAGSTPLRFEIHTLTPNEILDADALITAEPPKIFEEQPAPGRVGTVQAFKGYDLDAPSYLAERQKQAARRNAAVCLFGCPALKESTPGGNFGEQIDSLMRGIPGVLVDWLCEQIETMSVLTAVGEDEVASFLAEISAAGKNSSATSRRNPAGGKKKRSSGSTARTSLTKSGKRRGGGA